MAWRYTLPMLRHAMDQPALAPGDGPIGLVMVPTRELAMQVYREVNRFAKVVGLGVAAVYGGANLKQQIAELKLTDSIRETHSTTGPGPARDSRAGVEVPYNF